jgi:hypothetical protein
MTSQECVGATRSYTNVVWGMRSGTCSLKLKNDANMSTKQGIFREE